MINFLNPMRKLHKMLGLKRSNFFNNLQRVNFALVRGHAAFSAYYFCYICNILYSKLIWNDMLIVTNKLILPLITPKHHIICSHFQKRTFPLIKFSLLRYLVNRKLVKVKFTSIFHPACVQVQKEVSIRIERQNNMHQNVF